MPFVRQTGRGKPTHSSIWRTENRVLHLSKNNEVLVFPCVLNFGGAKVTSTSFSKDKTGHRNNERGRMVVEENLPVDQYLEL